MKAKLVFLTGGRSGTSVDLIDGEQTIGRQSTQAIRLSPDEIIVSAEHATIFFREGGFFIRDEESRNGTFVNRERVTERALATGDVIEFGLGGPSAQFVAGDADELTPTLDLSDPKAPQRLSQAAKARARQRTVDTGTGSRRSATREFMVMAYQRSSKRAKRTTVALAALTVLGLAAVLAWQQWSKRQLQAALGEFVTALEAERGSRAELAENLADVQTRYDSLLKEVEDQNRRAGSSARFRETFTRTYSRGVGLIVFSYGFSERGGTRLLRYQVDEQGQPEMTRARNGRPIPRIDFGGSGPPLQRQGSATGFLVDTAGWIITNRHVAEPWKSQHDMEFLESRGMDVEPRFIVLQAFFPPGDRAYSLVVHATSQDADVAIVRSVTSTVDAPALPLAGGDFPVAPGEDLVFIGYPTGVHNLLFRVDSTSRADILNRTGEDPILLARELAERRLIQPLVTTGAVSDTTTTEVIHTASTTGGGSGGPLIGADETVVAVHYAAVRSPTPGDPFQTQRGARVAFVWNILPADVRDRLMR
jgi:S1-C subfamily serine protease